MRIVEVVADVRQLLARNVEHTGRMKRADGDDHLFDAIPMFAVDGLRHQFEAAPDSRRIHDALVGPDLQSELHHQRAQIREVLLARDLLLRRRLNRNPGQPEPVRARMKQHLDRIPGDGRPDLPRIKLDVVDPELLERNRELEPDRPRADDGDCHGPQLYPAAKRAGSPVAPRDPFFTTHPRPHSTPEASRTVAGGPSEASDRRLNVRGGCPTPAGVAERIHAAWYLIRDPAGVENRHVRSSGGRSLRSDRRLPYETPPASMRLRLRRR